MRILAHTASVLVVLGLGCSAPADYSQPLPYQKVLLEDIELRISKERVADLRYYSGNEGAIFFRLVEEKTFANSAIALAFTELDEDAIAEFVAMGYALSEHCGRTKLTRDDDRLGSSTLVRVPQGFLHLVNIGPKEKKIVMDSICRELVPTDFGYRIQAE